MLCKKIVICDDDQGNLDVLELLLDLEGYVVIKENDSTKLITILKEDCPEILLLDLLMPIIGGDQIMRMIRSDSILKRMIIIAFSASPQGEQIAIEAGADFYIAKPYNIDDISTVIDLDAEEADTSNFRIGLINAFAKQTKPTIPAIVNHKGIVLMPTYLGIKEIKKYPTSGLNLTSKKHIEIIKIFKRIDV